jgi:RNA polymerase sigma factor (sigma-70 family)
VVTERSGRNKGELPEYWADIVASIQRGEAHGVEELYRAISKNSSGTLFRSVDPQSVEDYIHEIVVVVLEAIRAGEIRDPACLMGFVKTVTHRRVSLHIKTAMRHRRRMVSIEDGRDPVTPIDQSPEARLSFKQKVDSVKKAIASLPEREREILLRFYYQEQGPEQICREMLLTATQFRLSKSRAIAKCQDSLPGALPSALRVPRFQLLALPI